MRFIKIILPPLIAFVIFASLISFNPLKLSFEGLGSIGDGSAAGLIAYFKIFFPLQFAVAVLTQYLIIMPIWDRILKAHTTAFTVFCIVVLVCLILATGLSYIIWDPASGTTHLIHIVIFMTGVQVLYWAINFLFLALIDWRILQISLKPKAEDIKQESNDTENG